MPKSIISDRDPIFVSKFWQEFFVRSGTKLKMSSAYHPQTDGQSEVVNRCLEQYLRSFVHQWPRKWLEFLPWAEYWYNMTYHRSIGMTPFQALYGGLPSTIPLYKEGLSPVNDVDQGLRNRDDLIKQLKANLAVAINRMKQTADKNRRDVEFELGDLVLLKLHPYRQHTAFRRAHQKLASHFFGPYPVERRIGKVAYKLRLPEGVCIHPVFHVSLLKNYVGTEPGVTTDLPTVTEEGAVVLEPERIINTRWVKQSGKFIEESLVQWRRLPPEEATWEKTEVVREHFSNVDLADKGPLDGEGIDEPRRSSRAVKRNPKYYGIQMA